LPELSREGLRWRTNGATVDIVVEVTAPPTDIEVARLVATIRTRVLRLLRRRGIFAQEEDDDAPPARYQCSS
jgi:hypothetical protein